MDTGLLTVLVVLLIISGLLFLMIVWINQSDEDINRTLESYQQKFEPGYENIVVNVTNDFSYLTFREKLYILNLNDTHLPFGIIDGILLVTLRRRGHRLEKVRYYQILMHKNIM